MTTGEACEAERPLRRDAARNRGLILEAAAEVFAEHGIDAGYDEIARRAGVGVGTVYRRFPERTELVQALFESRIDGIIAAAEQATEHAVAWEGLVEFLEKVLDQQVADRGLKDVMMRTISADDAKRLGRDRLGPILDDLVERARVEGSLREGVAASDVGLLLVLLSPLSTPDEPGLWRRYLAICLDGLRARPDQGPVPLTAPTEYAVHCVVTNRA